MYGLTFICLCLVATVFAQQGTYVGRRTGGPRRVDRVFPDNEWRQSDNEWGQIRRPGDIITNGVIDRTVARNACYRGERPSYDRFGNVERCYSRYQCNDSRDNCRIIRGTIGTCCKPRRHIGGNNYCRDGSWGQGSCYSNRTCRRQFGRAYECQFQRNGYGTCCLRYEPNIRY